MNRGGAVLLWPGGPAQCDSPPKREQLFFFVFSSAQFRAQELFWVGGVQIVFVFRFFFAFGHRCFGEGVLVPLFWCH